MDGNLPRTSAGLNRDFRALWQVFDDAVHFFEVDSERLPVSSFQQFALRLYFDAQIRAAHRHPFPLGLKENVLQDRDFILTRNGVTYSAERRQKLRAMDTEEQFRHTPTPCRATADRQRAFRVGGGRN